MPVMKDTCVHCGDPHGGGYGYSQPRSVPLCKSCYGKVYRYDAWGGNLYDAYGALQFLGGSVHIDDIEVTALPGGGLGEFKERLQSRGCSNSERIQMGRQIMIWVHETVRCKHEESLRRRDDRGARRGCTADFNITFCSAELITFE